MAGNTLGGMFDFSKVTQFLDTMANAASQTAAAKKETATIAAQQNEKILQSATDYAQASEETLGVLKKVGEQQKAAEALAEGDIFDRISLIGEQIINPRAFTAEGRSQQMSEASQRLGIRGQVHNVQIQQAGAEIANAEAQENLKLADVNGEMAALRMQIEGMTMANQAFAQTELMRQQNLGQLDLPTLQKSLIGPPSQDGKIVIGGMPYTPTEIRERAKNVEVREKIAMLSPQASNPEYANLLQLSQDLQLSTYTIPELDKLKGNGYILPDGTQVAPSLFDQHYQRQNLAQQADLEKRMSTEVLHHQVPQLLEQGVTLTNNVKAHAPVGSPLASAQVRYQTELAAVATASSMPEGQTYQARIAQITRIQQADANLQKAIASEALTRAAGDKDLAQIYEQQISGQPVSPQIVEEVLTERFSKNKGFGEVLPPDMSLRIQQSAEKELSTMRQEQAADIMGTNGKMSDRDMRAEAARRAFDKERKQAGVKGVNIIQQEAALRTDNPAKLAGMVKGQLDDIQGRSAAIGLDKVQKAEGLTAVEMQAIRIGRPQDAGINPTRAAAIAQNVNAEVMATEYDLYEAHRPGLGYEMQQWYQKMLPEMAKSYTEKLNPVERAFAGNAVLNEALKYNDMMTSIDESFSNRGKQMALDVATQRKAPNTMWPILLQMDDRLADSQKQMIYRDIIEPVVKQGNAIKRNPEETTSMIFDALKNYKNPNDPVTMSAVRSFMRNLPKSLDNYDIGWSTDLFIAHDGSNRLNNLGSRIERALPWLKPVPQANGTQTNPQDNPALGIRDYFMQQ